MHLVVQGPCASDPPPALGDRARETQLETRRAGTIAVGLDSFRDDRALGRLVPTPVDVRHIVLHVEPVVDEHGLEVLAPAIPEEARPVISLVARLLDSVAQGVEVLHSVESVEARPRGARAYREAAFTELRTDRSVHVQIGRRQLAEGLLRRPGPDHVGRKDYEILPLTRYELLEGERDGAEHAVRAEERRKRERPAGAVLVGDPVECRSSQKDPTRR